MSERQSGHAGSARMLHRQLGLWGATAMGMGSILGTGVFVSIGIAAGVAGPAVVLALVIAAGVAACNGLNSAQLAAAQPVSGGTYEYGYRLVNPLAGFTAGWTFLLAKSASAATAALGFSGYLLNLIGVPAQRTLVPVALGAVLLFTVLVLTGIRRTSVVNVAIVSVTILALGAFIAGGVLRPAPDGLANFSPFFDTPNGQGPISAILHAAALMFVAYTGYGRIATLGEEVADPGRTIPRAVIITLLLTMVLYIGAAASGIAAIGADGLSLATGEQAAPLEVAARAMEIPGLALLVAFGAVTAMLGVLLNLILGLSRVLLAMGRRRDMPGFLSRLDESGVTPYWSVIVIGALIAGLVMVGDVRVTWSFSAFSVLIYYAITNISALRLQKHERMYPAWLAWIGLFACLFLAFWVEVTIWLVGLGCIAVGVIWHLVAVRMR